LAAIAALSLPSPPNAEAQFNPRGRGKPGFQPQGRQPQRPAPARPAQPTQPAKPAQKTPPASRASATQPPAEGAEAPIAEPGAKAPSTDSLIVRYTGIVLSQPGAAFPLQRLAELYRQRDGKLDALIADFEKRAQSSDRTAAWNALVALAGIYKQDGRPEKTIETYERAIAQQPTNPVALVALAHVLAERGDTAGARRRFEQALPQLKADAEKEQLYRTLLGLALDQEDFKAAEDFHRQLVTRSKGSFFVRGELGRELMQRGKYERAVEAYREVVKLAAGDNRALAPALRDLGRALAKAGKGSEALDKLRQGLRVAGAESGIRREILETTVEVYREQDRLRELIGELEKEAGQDFDRLRLLGGLYEETGQVDKALDAYKKALARNNRDVGTRLKVVQILQIQGELDQAIREVEALIRAAPHNPDFTFQLAEALIQRGDRKQALAHLERLEARSGGDEETLAALVDFYERVEEKERALAVLQRLSQMGARDPRHLVELGDRYWQKGEKQKALQTWQRIKLVVTDRPRALRALGEVYLEHDMPREALESLREAMRLAPTQLDYKKAYALALERTGAAASGRDARNRQYDEARKIWEELLRGASDNANLAREARQHVVTLYSLMNQLRQRMPPLERRLKASPPDLEAGRLLAEAQMRLRLYREAEGTLQKVVQHAPGDAQSLGQLERVLVQQRKLRDAIAVLEKLVTLEPKRAREYYQRMAQYAAELYQDDLAIRYAARAVELSPEDAEGHRKLGEMYRRRQQIDKAIGAFRQAISKNDRLFPVYFQLAELLLSRGEIDEADRLLRRVVRASPDEELVAQALRLSMQVNLGRGTLESLEKELLPVALGNPQRPIYRRLLVEIYGALAFPLAQQARSAGQAEADAARQALRRIGERAVKPLLDALGDERDDQQRIAIELFSHIQNKSAGPALFSYATGAADSDLRVRAMIAVGALRDPGMLSKLSELLEAEGQVRADESDPIAVAAAWGVANMQSPKAGALLRGLVASDAPSMRALGALGLGMLGDRSSAKRLTETVDSLDAGPLPRAAAAFALGDLGEKTAIDALARAAEASDVTVRAAALLALARLGASAARQAISEALVSPEAELRAAAAAAALAVTTGQYRAPRGPLAIPQGRVDVRALLDRRVPSGYSPEERAKALIELQAVLARAAAAAAQSSPERARGVADALLARGGRPAFGPLTRDLDSVKEPLKGQAEKAADAVGAAVVTPFVALASHPSAEVRASSVQLLATRTSPDARAAVLRALEDRDESVQRAALAALETARTPGAVPAVVSLLESGSDWPVRVRAAHALGAIAAGSRDAKASAALARAARADRFSLVREEAARALALVDRQAARSVLSAMASGDAEPRVRRTAQSLLQGAP
jgi:tetratricopeptide (TPR) repeat protein